MKCLLCPAELEAKSIHAEDVHSQKTHSAELAQWEHVTVQVSRNGGSVQLLAGDLCPNEKLVVGQVHLSKGSK